METQNTIEAEIVEDRKEIVLVEIKYPVNTTDLESLLKEYTVIPDINPDADEDLVGEQYQFVLKGHKAFVKARTGIEKTRKQLKQPALDYGKTVDNIAKEFQFIFEEMYFSDTLKSRKSEELFYKINMKNTELFQKSLYIDDKEEHFKIPEKLGALCIKFDSIEKLKKDFMELRIY